MKNPAMSWPGFINQILFYLDEEVKSSDDFI